MSDKSQAKIFSLGGAELIEMGASDAVRKSSGAGIKDLESNYNEALIPMKNNARAEKPYSGASLDAFGAIFNERLSPMRNYAENVPPLYEALMKGIERGYNNALEVNKQSDSLALSERAIASIKKMNTVNVTQKDKVRSA